MRMIGQIAEAQLAERFQNVLIAQGKRCRLDPGAGGIEVWIFDDDDVPAAKAELTQFLENPDAEAYRGARTRADAVLREEAARLKQARKQHVSMSQRWSQSGRSSEIPVTWGILLLCVLVFAETDLLKDPRGVKALFLFSTDGTWGAVRAGEWWRVLTPAILHGGIFHIFFNLLWWWQLGAMIELRKGSLYLLLLTLVIAAGSNTLQFELGSPWFLGLSGVVFGLFGYAWVKGNLDPGDGIGVAWQDAQWMLIWFVVCSLGFVGRVANWAHAGGLILGVSIGAVSALLGQRRRR